MFDIEKGLARIKEKTFAPVHARAHVCGKGKDYSLID